MNLVKVDSIPPVENGLRAPYHNLREKLFEFLESGDKIVRVDFLRGEYRSTEACSNALRVGVKYYKLDNVIKVVVRNYLVYLKRID